MKHINLTKGKQAIVDDEDYDELIEYNWHYGSAGYAIRTVYPGKKVLMHRVVDKTPYGLETDHINRNRLDNRKSNLMSCTRKENMQNKSAYRKNRTLQGAY